MSALGMQCDICHRLGSHQTPLNCKFCAQATIYQGRLLLAQSLLENESLEKDVEQRITAARTPGKLSNGQEAEQCCSSLVAVQASADQAASNQTTENILSHVKALREQIQHMKLDIAKKKANLARRRKEMAPANEELFNLQSTCKEPISREIKRVLHAWEDLHNRTAEQRLNRSAQTARLFSLQQHRRRKGTSGKDVYSIGFTPIPDLRELNNAVPTHVTTSLNHLASLVHLTSHNLLLKLPAQIILPHSEYPHPTILSPNVSYTNDHLSFPGSTPSRSAYTSPTASRHTDRRSQPRARPLYLNKKLSSLAKDDPLAYAHFVEGVTLLAWNVAWLCKTQGINIGSDSWEDACAMGRNLWLLLLSPSTRPSISQQSDRRTPLGFPLARLPSAKRIPPAGETNKDLLPTSGFFSHGTAYGFLAAAPGNEYMRDWRLQNPVKVIDKVKAMLLADRTGAEWEILEGNEWEDADAEAAVRDAGQVEQPVRIEETGILVKAEDGVARDKEGAKAHKEDERERRASGWTKLKSR